MNEFLTILLAGGDVCPPEVESSLEEPSHGCYACGEHSMTYRLVASLYCTPETNVAWCVKEMSVKKTA